MSKLKGKMEESPIFPYEKLTILSVPQETNSPWDVLADFDKLDWCSNRLDSEYPVDDINYCEGKAKISHPFQKITKLYRTHKNVFLFHSTLRDEDLRAMIMNGISEKTSNNSKAVEEFQRKLNHYLGRIEKGELEADAFLNDNELKAFFSGCHSASPDQPRNIHENLIINVHKAKKTLKVSSYFNHMTPLMEAEKSELKRVKVLVNGERVMSIFKDDDEKRNYLCTKQSDINLEIGWPAITTKGEKVFCTVILKINQGKVGLEKHFGVNSEDGNSGMPISELTKQNTSVLLSNKTLYELLGTLLSKLEKEASNIKTKPAQSPLEASSLEAKVEAKFQEKLTIQQVPREALNREIGIFNDFGKLEFSPGPFSPSDEINYNDGIDESPFEKISKLYLRQKDIFLFNAVLLDSKKRARVLDIVREKCRSIENSFVILAQFKIQMDIYLERVSSGTEDAKEILDSEMKGFFYGYYEAQEGQPRNIHATLNVNVTNNGQTLEISKILNKITSRMEEEASTLERIKIFGNGKRVMTIIKGKNGRRNYSFCKLGKVDLEIEWVGREAKSGRKADCCLTLELKSGQIGMKRASIDGVIVKEASMFRYALHNKQVLIKNKSLSKVVEEVFYNSGRGTPCTIDSMKAKIQPAMAGAADMSSSIFECRSEEKLKFHLAQNPQNGELKDHPKLKGLFEDFGKLEFTSGPFNPSDKLNYSVDPKDSPFNKICKFYEQHKDIFLFTAVLLDNDLKSTLMSMIKKKCGEDAGTMLEFEQNMRAFLERAYRGKIFAVEFIGFDRCRGIDVFFSGTLDGSHSGDTYSRLNINLGGSCTTLNISDYFGRPTPGNGELESINIYGNGQKVATVSKQGNGQRNYTFKKLTEMDLEIKWKAIEFEPTTSSRTDRDCKVVLKIEKGTVAISKSSLDGQTIQAASILELAKQNDDFLLNNKSLFDIMRFSCLNVVIKGATTLFFTAASTAEGGDATKLNNSCTDVFLTLMLQDQEQKERILDMVSKRSSKPTATRKEFLDRMDVFKQRFADGEYVMGGEGSSTNANRRETPVVIRKAKRMLGTKAVAEVKTGGTNEKYENTNVPSDDVALDEDFGAVDQVNQNEEVGGGEETCEAAAISTGNYDCDDDDDDEDDNNMHECQSLILLGAGPCPIDLLH